MAISDSELEAPWVDAAGVEVYDQTGIEDVDVRRAVAARVREVASSLASWSEKNRAGADFFTTPTGNAYSVMRACRATRRDDVVEGVLEAITALSIQGMRWGSSDGPLAEGMDAIFSDAHVWDLFPQMFQELSTFGQTVVAVEWGAPEDRKLSRDAKARKKVRARSIKRITTLDPLCVVPYNADIFGKYSLAWHVDGLKAAELRMGRGDLFGNSIFKGFVDQRDITDAERTRLGRLGVSVENLIELDPDNVFRLTVARGSYERFPRSPMEALFPILSQKSELRAADGVALRGTANYILLVKQGTDAQPGKQAEIDALRQDFRTLAKVPIIVSDHRLSVEILTPDTQYALQAERYDLLDQRIASRMLTSLAYGGKATDTDVQLRAKAISSTLTSRRAIITDFFESLVLEHMLEGELEQTLTLDYTPRTVVVDNGSLMANAMQNARDRRLISRRTLLEHFGFEQETEAERITLEGEKFDDVFKESVPFNSPDNQTGRPVGGGDSSNDEATARTAGGNSKKEK